MEDRRIQLRKLASLENSKANEYLISFARELINEMKKSDDNDFITERLDLLGEFAFRVPAQALEIIRFVISSKPLQPKAITGSFGEYEGKTFKDLLLGAIELLDRLRYIVPDDVLILTAQLSLREEKEVHDKALKVVGGYSGYDFRVLPQIGYSPQRKITDFIMAWSTEERILHLDFIEVAARQLLSTSVGGEEMTAENTLTIRFGQVAPTVFLKKLRVDVLDVVFELFKSINDINAKVRLVQALDNVTLAPHNVEVSPDLIQMMRQDSEYLIAVYRKMVSEGNPAIISHIDRTLLWLNRNEIFKTDKSEELRKEILEDKFYQLFRILVGDHAAFQEEGGWKEAERKHREQITSLIDSINDTNLGDWSEKLNRIAEQRASVESWRFSNFEHFLIEFTQTKPQLADCLFDDAFTRKLPLRWFLVGFLIGIRTKNKLELWDKYTELIIKSQDIEYIRALVHSLCLPIDTDLKIDFRNKDIDIVETIVKHGGCFSFLKGITNSQLNYTLFETILCNHKRAVQKMESLFVREIDNNPQYLEMFLRQIPLAVARGWVTVKELQPQTVNFLANKLALISNLDWELQELLLDIGRVVGCAVVLDVFLTRIQHDKTLKRTRIVADRRYEAIPYHIDPKLQEFISQDINYRRVMNEWVKNMTPDWSTYNWHISTFMQRIGTGFNEIIMSLIKEGDDVSLKKAALAMHSIEGSHLDLLIEIARRTENNGILSTVSATMCATGVVSGEYGIANAFENKAKELEKYKDDPSDRVRQFVARMIQSFKEDAVRERLRADEEKQLRRIEFEG